MVSIRKLGVADAPLLAAIGSKSLVESHGHSAAPSVMQAYCDEKFTEAALVEELSDPQHIFHGIFHNGIPAGYSKIIYHQPLPHIEQKAITKMERLYLLKEYYNLKLGKQLFDFNLGLSKAQGEAGMWLYVWKENERALRFYAREGFRVIGDGWFRLTADHANPNWQMLLLY
ncbi:MAG: hypothetical protein JWP27_2606 [Flaviaesturariibacter sp.]|nr:hypothetical protein [Flaviaesturariibacter sp.]